MTVRDVMADWAITRLIVLAIVLAICWASAPPPIVLDRGPLPEAVPSGAIDGVLRLDVQ